MIGSGDSTEAMGYDLTGSSELTVIPSVCAVAVAAMAGTAADHLHGNGMSLTTVRKIFQSLGHSVTVFECLRIASEHFP